jgi:hypothetical protein
MRNGASEEHKFKDNNMINKNTNFYYVNHKQKDI